MLRTADSAHAEGSENRLLVDRFRCPQSSALLRARGGLSDESGYFRFGDSAICYGQCASGTPAKSAGQPLHDASAHVVIDGASIQLPFDAAQVLNSLRCERYTASAAGSKPLLTGRIVRGMYYFARPILGVPFRKHLQRRYLQGWEKIPFPKWPVDLTVEDIFERLLAYSMTAQKVEKIPFIWFWPAGAPSCTMITHDVETLSGLNFCGNLWT
jgi:hypothetical protein